MLSLLDLSAVLVLISEACLNGMGKGFGVIFEFNLAAENATVSRNVAWSQVIILTNFICFTMGRPGGPGR